ncbi:MAG TPA: Wzz/FepE/Etk N-terminal domain-containing protein, partial [Pyrinomonadaceae bacterium]
MQDQRLIRPLPPELDRPLSDPPRHVYLGEGPQPKEQADFRYFLGVILKRKWLTLGIVVTVTCLAALYMYRLPSVYEAETTIRIEQKNESFLRSKDIVINTASDPVYWHTQLKLLENPQLMRQLALNLDLVHNPEFLGPRGGGSAPLDAVRRAVTREKTAQENGESASIVTVTEKDVESLTPEERARLAPYVGMLLANLTVEPIPTTNLVKIRFRHTSPEIAMKVTDSLARLFIYDDIKKETLGSQNAAEQVAKQIADLQLTIKRQEEERLNFIRNHDLPLGEVKGQNLTADRLGTLSGQVLTAEGERKSLQANYEAAQRAADVWSVPEVQENKGI